MSETREKPSPSGVARKVRRRGNAVLFLPVGIFAVVAAIFLFMELSGASGRSDVPSALIGQEAPRTTLTPMEDMELPGLDTEALRGEVAIVNIFASWCAPCRAEHPLLMRLAENHPDVTLVGLNYKDDMGNAQRFLGELGNPYDAIGVDPSGRAAIDWGVYGVPETFLLGRDGTIIWKQIGPLTPQIVQRQLEPALQAALDEPAPAADEDAAGS